jgi:ADP-heptose:LPS heptosyltransferase
VRTLAVRLDSLGDLLVTGPAIRALAAGSDHLTLLCGPRGRDVADLLPGVEEVLCWRAPWIDPEPDPVDRAEVEGLRARLQAGRYDRAVVFTSFHQSALPTALLLRLAGVPWAGAISEDYPGALLDLRLTGVPDDIPEHERALRLARAAGAELSPGDDGLPAVRRHLAALPAGVEPPYVVLHPGTSVPARAWSPQRYRSLVDRLVELGHRVVVTGGPGEEELTAFVADGIALDLGGRLTVPQLAEVLALADAVVVGNTGPAHLAAAVRTPVVSLYAPTVPAVRWRPYGDRVVLLGDQHAACRDTRATVCPIPGHPCLDSVTPGEVVAAVTALCGQPAPVLPV